MSRPVPCAPPPRRWTAALARPAVAVLLAALAPHALHARSIVIQRFEADYVVLRDGAVNASEAIELRFEGSWNGIIRSLPVEYRDRFGSNYSLLLEVVAVTDEAGNPLRHEIERAGRFREIRIWVPGALDAVRTVVLKYRIANGLRFFDDHDEFYWNVTGTDWEYPIEAAEARVYLPPEVTGLRTEAFTGPFGSTERAATLETEANFVRVRADRRLGPGEGLTIVAGWDPGVIRRPTLAEKAALFLRSNWAFFLPILALGIMWALWYSRGRDPDRLPVYARYEPPENLTPAQVGALADHSADMRDITAALVDLAIRGYITIEEKKKDGILGIGGGSEYVFRLEKQRTDWSELEPHEQRLLTAVFSGGHGDVAAMSDLKDHLPEELPRIRRAILDELVARRCYGRRPDTVRKLYLAAGGVLIVASWILIDPINMMMFGIYSPLAKFAGTLAGLVVAGFGWHMPARTIKGVRMLEGVLGFKEFLGRVESDRFRRMIQKPEDFEKNLPFAVALAVDDRWADAFAEVYRDGRQPRWYRSRTGHFHLHTFTRDFSGALRQAAVAKAAASGARSSGFGGGGFSGGGFGGGGGRGF